MWYCTHACLCSVTDHSSLSWGGAGLTCNFWATWHLLRSVTITSMQIPRLGAELVNLVSCCAVSGCEKMKAKCSSGLRLVLCLLQPCAAGPVLILALRVLGHLQSSD